MFLGRATELKVMKELDDIVLESTVIVLCNKL